MWKCTRGNRGRRKEEEEEEEEEEEQEKGEKTPRDTVWAIEEAQDYTERKRSGDKATMTYLEALLISFIRNIIPWGHDLTPPKQMNR
jgi:hypothetical protein